MATDDFFDEQTAQSRTKAFIVSTYVDKWATIVQKPARARGQPVGYLDLFAGRGEYGDSNESTPLLVLRNAVANRNYLDIFEADFNEADPCHATALRCAIGRVPGLSLLRRRPTVTTELVDDGYVAGFDGRSMPPVLTFADPYGYKGLTRRLIRTFLRGWGSEVVFFFNFSRVNAAINNLGVEQHIDELFGAAEADRLRARVAGLEPDEREDAVLAQLALSLRAEGAEFILPFTFKKADGSRTSHHLVHVTKHRLGYEVMKGVMARASSWTDDGVPSYQCGPAPERDLFTEVETPLDKLKEELVSEYAGRRVTVGELWSLHHVGRPFVAGNYREAVRELGDEGRAFVECPQGKRWLKKTFPDWLVVHFPAVAGTA